MSPAAKETAFYYSAGEVRYCRIRQNLPIGKILIVRIWPI